MSTDREPTSLDAGAEPGRVDCDVLIVGGGLVGSALAAALEPLALRVLLVEAHDPARLEQPSFDARVTALANGSRRILDALGLWASLAPHAEPIVSIHVSERGRFGSTRIDAAEEGVAALGYTIENRRLGEALWARLGEAQHCWVLGRARLARFEQDGDGVRAEIEQPAGRTRVRARLLVAADGARSQVRAALGIAVREHRYAQQALIVNCTTDRPHRGVAYERFAAGGPLAVLPLTAERVGVVWTLPADEAERTAALPDEVFRDALQQAFGYRLGRIARTGTRALHPLKRMRSHALGAGRVVLVGNAAVTLHPVAAQGFNLALRDVATLAELIAEASAAGDGHAGLAVRYGAVRAGDQRQIARLTHGLVALFGLRGAGFGAARGLGLAAFDLMPGGKAALARQMMGVAGRVPRLARGLPLAGASGASPAPPRQ